jgi:hypothetical protein
MKSAVVLVLIALAALLLTPTTPPRASAQSTTSHEELRAIVDALFAGDPARIEELIRFKQVPCVEEPMGLEPLPICAPGTPDGTLVDGFPRANCEGRYFQPHELEGVAEFLAAPGLEVVAVYPYPGDGHQSSLFYGDYLVVTSGSPPGRARGVFIGNGGIAGTDGGCTADVETYIEFWGLSEPVDLDALSPATAPSTGGGSSGPSAPVTLAGVLAVVVAALGMLATALLGAGLARRRS